MNSLLIQLKKRRLSLGFKQKDMMMRIGVSRQQYQQIESKGNPRLSTLGLIAKGLNSELMLIPSEKMILIKTILEEDTLSLASLMKPDEESDLTNNPWKNILEND